MQVCVNILRGRRAPFLTFLNFGWELSIDRVKVFFIDKFCQCLLVNFFLFKKINLLSVKSRNVDIHGKMVQFGVSLFLEGSRLGI